MREPSLGPCFGIKGGAAGGGYAQVVPMEDINLHFTGDFHAITSAHNLLSAMLDNHIHHGNELDLDSRTLVHKRVLDMNDRALRQITCGMGGKANGYVRQDGFDITVASEVMAIFCLASSLEDLKQRLGNMIVGYSRSSQEPVFARDLNADGAMTALLKDAFQPNLVQTLENNPALVHGGPFANIAHGCNSVSATMTALKLGDYVITEAGFGADLGAEKFIDIKCRMAGLRPQAAVLVATIRALKFHGGVGQSELNKENLGALEKGFPNLERHWKNIVDNYGLKCIVAINQFSSDSDAEIELIKSKVNSLGGRLLSQLIGLMEVREPRSWPIWWLQLQRIKNLAGINMYIQTKWDYGKRLKLSHKKFMGRPVLRQTKKSENRLKKCPKTIPLILYALQKRRCHFRLILY